MPNLRTQIPSKLKAYNAVVALGLAKNYDAEISFPINCDRDQHEYIHSQTTVGDLMREALAEVNENLPTFGEIQALIELLKQVLSVPPSEKQLALTQSTLNQLTRLQSITSVR